MNRAGEGPARTGCSRSLVRPPGLEVFRGRSEALNDRCVTTLHHVWPTRARLVTERQDLLRAALPADAPAASGRPDALSADPRRPGESDCAKNPRAAGIAVRPRTRATHARRNGKGHGRVERVGISPGEGPRAGPSGEFPCRALRTARSTRLVTASCGHTFVDRLGQSPTTRQLREPACSLRRKPGAGAVEAPALRRTPRAPHASRRQRRAGHRPRRMVRACRRRRHRAGCTSARAPVTSASPRTARLLHPASARAKQPDDQGIVTDRETSALSERQNSPTRAFQRITRTYPHHDLLYVLYISYSR